MNPTVQITVVGNVVEDPELRFTPSGAAVATFRVASTPRHLDKATNTWTDGETTFLTVTQWRAAAENVAESLKRGHRVVVVGRLHQRSYETKDGVKRTVFEIQADEVALSLSHATATVIKASRATGPGAGDTAAGEDPWATDAPPF
jgi:single-strand DNA-binding protein